MSNLADLLPAGGGQNNTDFVADGTIASGKPVILTAAGKAAEVANPSTSISENVGTEAQFTSSDTDRQKMAYTESGKVVITYQDTGGSYYGTAVVGTVSGNTISYGTPVVFNSASTSQHECVYDTTNQKVVVHYMEVGAGPSYTGQARVGTVSGTSISFGTKVQFSSANIAWMSSAFDTVAGKTVTAYGDGNGKAIVGTVSGTSISFGAEATVRSGQTTEFATVYDTNADKTVILYRESNIAGAGEGVVGTVSGTSISFGTAVQFDSAPVTVVVGAYDSSSNQVICAYTKVHAKVVLGTVSGTSISFGAIASAPTSGSSYWNAVCYDSNVNKVLVTYAYPDASPYSNGTIATGTVAGTSLTFATPPATFNPTTMSEHIASVYDSTNKKAVVFYGENNASGEGLVFQAAGTALESNLTSTNLLGIASGAISDTATGTINTWGSRNEVQTGLTIGSDYYVQADGTIVAGATNVAYDISNATYTQNFSVSSQSTDPVGLLFSPDGTSMYVVSGVYPPGAKNIFQYALTTAFDISTASLSKDFDASAEDSQARGIQFNLDGTKMFINGVTGDAYYQYSLSSAYDISTGSYDSVSFSLSSQDGNMEDVVFNADGTKFYGVGLNTYAIYQYSCSSAFDLSTASYDSVSFSISSQDNSPRDLFFKPDGSKMWLLGRQNHSIYQYSLSSAFDLSTASYDSIQFSLSSEETAAGGLAFSANGEKFYVCGEAGDDVNQYATSLSTFSTTYLIGNAITTTQINIKDYTG